MVLLAASRKAFLFCHSFSQVPPGPTRFGPRPDQEQLLVLEQCSGYGHVVRALGSLAAVVCLAATLTATGPALHAETRAPQAAALSCGQPGKPACPLQKWMRDYVARAYAARDATRLGAALEQAAALNPEPKRWKQWATMSMAGATRARRGGPTSALTSCVSCHDTFRRQYVQSYRTRRLPPTN